jgi:hypothetical protein
MTTWARTRAAAVGGQLLTPWAPAPPVQEINLPIFCSAKCRAKLKMGYRNVESGENFARLLGCGWREAGPDECGI